MRRGDIARRLVVLKMKGAGWVMGREGWGGRGGAAVDGRGVVIGWRLLSLQVLQGKTFNYWIPIADI